MNNINVNFFGMRESQEREIYPMHTNTSDIFMLNTLRLNNCYQKLQTIREPKLKSGISKYANKE